MSAEFPNGAPILVQLPGIPQPVVSPTGNGWIYFDSTSGKLMASENGASYVNLIGGGGGPQSIIETPNSLTFVEVQQAVGATGGDRITLQIGNSDPNRTGNLAVVQIDSNNVQVVTPSGIAGDTPGADLDVTLGAGFGAGQGGSFNLTAAPSAAGAAGNVSLFAGAGNALNSGGAFQASGGNVPVGSNQSGGICQLGSGSGDGSGDGGPIQLVTGDGGTSGTGGNIILAPSAGGSVAGSVDLTRFSGSGAVSLRFWDDAISHYTTLRGPATASNTSFRLPAADGTASQALLTNGAGVLSFGNVPSSNASYVDTVQPALGATTVQTGIDQLKGPTPQASATIYISNTGGSDTTGTGTIYKPFQTFTKAFATINAIGDASPTKRYCVQVGPGFYPENASIPANVAVRGVNAVDVRLTGNWDMNDPSWHVDQNSQCAFEDVTFTGSFVMDFTLNSGSNQGKVYAWNCRWNNTPSFNAFSNINQGVLFDCFFFAGYSQVGMNLTFSNCGFINGGTISLTSVGNTPGQGTNVPTIATFFGGGTDGTVALSWATNGASNAVTLQAFGLGVNGPLTISGAQATYIGTVDSIPQTVTLTNSAPAPTLVNYAPGLGYTPGTSANWVGPAPTTVQQALDRIAAKVAVLNGGPIP